MRNTSLEEGSKKPTYNVHIDIPLPDIGQRSVTLMTIEFATVGKKGGSGAYVFNRVMLKHLPQAGP